MSEISKEIFAKPSSQGDLATLAITIARLASNLHLALEKIEAATDVDLSEIKTEIVDVNREAFTSFKDMTGWEGPGWADSHGR